MDFFSFRAASLSIPLFLKFQLLNIYYWTASGVVKPSPSMGFRGQPACGLKMGQSNRKRNIGNLVSYKVPGWFSRFYY